MIVAVLRRNLITIWDEISLLPRDLPMIPGPQDHNPATGMNMNRAVWDSLTLAMFGVAVTAGQRIAPP